MLQLIIGIALTVLFVVAIARNVDGAQLMIALRSANPVWIVTAIVLFLVGYACRIARWRTMLSEDNPQLTWLDCSLPFLASVAANNVLPLRLGDLLRVFGFSRRLDVPTSMMLASLLVERLLDLMCLLLALGGCILFIRLEHGFAGTLLSLGGVGISIIVFLVAALLLFPYTFERPVQFTIQTIARVFPIFAQNIESFTGRIFKALRHLSHGPRMLVLFCWSGAAWTLEGLVFWSTAKSFPGFNSMAGWLAFPVSTLATLLPSSPGYVGTFDYFAIKSAVAVGNEVATATAFALLVHLVLWLPATLLGGASLLIFASGRTPDNSFNKQEMQVDA